MFCDEPVIRVYEGRQENILQANAFLDCYHGISYHVAEGYRIVLETEHYFISLSDKGIGHDKKTVAIEDFELPGEYLEYVVYKGDECGPDWIEYEQTLFCGQRLNEVSEIDGAYFLSFDDFDMKIVPHQSGEEISGVYTNSYLQVYGCERLLRKPCSCGGTGVLFLDRVSDYFVCCKKCKMATWAQMNAQDAIDEWNCGYLNWDASKIVIE